MDHVLGIDTSTTATKAIVVDAAGAVVGSGAAEYGFDAPEPGWTEQDPALWWDATRTAIRAALHDCGCSGSDIAAVGLTGQMHGAVLLDRAGEVVRPALLWNDQRTADQCASIRESVGRERLVALTGNDALTGFTAPKLLWVREREPQQWQRVAHLLLPKDFVRLRLTGEHATDVADASGTLLLEVAQRAWSDDVLDALQLDAAMLPRLFEGPQQTGVVTARAAAETGLREGTPVAAGGGDQAANAVGLGAVTPAVGALSLGTSGVVFIPTQRPIVEARGRLHAFCHAVPGMWHVMGVVLSAAGSLRWYRDTFAPGTDFATLVAEASDVPAGAEGLIFLPYLTGERTPHADPAARGGFVGATVRHTRAHCTRAVLEGVAYGMRDALELMRSAGVAPPEQFRISGGGTRSPLWTQLLADVLQVRLAATATSEGAAFGAALLAAVTAGWHPTPEAAAAALVQPGAVTVPGSGDLGAYEATYQTYRELYPALAPSFAAWPTGTN
jgi:xylulokinase